MEAHLVIRTFEPQEWPAYRALRLRALADSPDAFTASLAEAQARPPEAWAARMHTAAVSGRDCPLVAQLNGVPVGLAWAMADGAEDAVVNLFQVWVAPESRGCGVAGKLLQAAINWANSRDTREIRLEVTAGNTAAEQLYARAGFRNVGAAVPRGGDSSLSDQAMKLELAHRAG